MKGGAGYKRLVLTQQTMKVENVQTETPDAATRHQVRQLALSFIFA